ncbi:MAG: TIGR02281 family clan AA aspartic protease [Albidovulum sp.]
MDSDETARIIYLGLILVAVAGSYLAANRKNLGKTAQQAAIWGLIFVGAVAVAGLWPDIRRQTLPHKPVTTANGTEIRAAEDGHYYIDTTVNGTNVRFVVDTGATNVVLTERDARRVGFDPDTLAYTGRASTANGMVLTAPVRLKSFLLGPFKDEDVRAMVNGGDLDTSLLGMSYLSQFEMTLTQDRLILRR